MRIGMNMLLWAFRVQERHFSVFPALKETGFDGLEFQITPDDGEPHFAAIGKVLDDFGLQRTGVAGVPPGMNPASPDAAERQRAVDYLRSAIDKTVALGGDLLGGPLHSSFKVFSGQGPTDAELSWSAEVLREAATHAQAAGVRLALEFLNRFECYLVNTAAQTRELLDRIDHPFVGLHYDTHHAHIEERDVTGAITQSRGRIFHVHISESDRGTPGLGQVDWPATFRALRQIHYDGWLTIESFSRLDPEFAAAVHIWRDCFPNAEQVYRHGFEFIREMVK